MVAELDVDEEVLKKPTGGVRQAYLEAVQKRLRHETSRDCPATEEKWLLTELKSNEWWPRSHKAKWVCDKLGLVMSEQAYYVDISALGCQTCAGARRQCRLAPRAAPALMLVLIAGAAITSSGELRPSTGTISWSADRCYRCAACAEAAKIAKATATAAATAAGLAVVDPMELLLLALVVAQEANKCKHFTSRNNYKNGTCMYKQHVHHHHVQHHHQQHQSCMHDIF